LGLLAAPAGAMIITQLGPDPSVAEATWSEQCGGDHNEVDLTKVFKDPAAMDEPLVLKFTVGYGEEYGLTWVVHYEADDDVGEEVTNLTGEAWWDYHFMLVNVPADSTDPLFADARFVELDGVTSDVFGDPVSISPYQIDFVGGPVEDQGVVHFSGIHIAHNGVEGAVFYLHQIPTPEPTTLALLLAPALVALRRRR
jgi:hypothetical protein